MERIKKMKYVLPVLAVGCLCTLTSVNYYITAKKSAHKCEH